METSWENLKNIIKQTAEETIGYRTETIRNDWYDEECRVAIEKRNELRAQWLSRSTRLREAEYKTARSEAKKDLQKEKASVH